MRKKIIITLIVLSIIPLTSALEINSFDTYEGGSQNSIFTDGENVSFKLNASNSESAELTVMDSNQTVQLDGQQMNLVKNNSFEIYEYNYTLSNPEGGNWNASAKVLNGGNATEELDFHVATDKPHFYSVEENPSFVKLGEDTTIEAKITDTDGDIQNVRLDLDNGSSYNMNLVQTDSNLYTYELDIEPKKPQKYNYNITVDDSAGNTNKVQDVFTSYIASKKVDISVKVSASCSSSLSYFLLPGDGKIVQNKTGVFVEILENSGNVESNITIDYLKVTDEGNEAWSPGEPIGPIIEDYDGELFENINVGEGVTYFKLFKASYDFGNYTGRSKVTTACSSAGKTNVTEDKNYLKDNFQGENVTEDNFTRWNNSVVSTSLVTAEVDSANFTNTSSETVSEQRSGTTAYESGITLNSTNYDVFVFNGTSTLDYDYSCASTTGSISNEGSQCAYKTSIIDEYMIKVSDIGANGNNASYSLQEENEDRLNTTVECGSVDNDTARCDYFYDFFESFSFFGNFEIVDAIGENQGGANKSGNQTTNQTIEGNNNNPGQTPVPEPEPEPVPEPEPEPDPVIRVDIESVEERYSTKQGQFGAAEFEVTNIGNTEVTDIVLEPLVDRVRPSWEIREARIENLSEGETVTREIFVRPTQDTSPGEYVVPVSASNNGDTLDLDYYTLEVKKSEFLPRISIAESPQQIDVGVESERTIPILLENTGEVDLQDINARLQNIEDCGTMASKSVENLRVNDTASLQLNIQGGERTQECETTLVVSSKDGAYAFGDLTVTTVPNPGLIPEDQRVPLIGILWTAVLALYAYFTREYDLESLTVKLPFLLLIMGETVIIIYTVVNYYGIQAGTLLPF